VKKLLFLETRIFLKDYHGTTFSWKTKSFVGKNATLLFWYFCNEYANEFDVMSNYEI
jgi:hypothetical protein